jgi:quercetin dioxygenase-like cupin family protein
MNGRPDSGHFVVHSRHRIDSEVAHMDRPFISNTRTGQRMRFVAEEQEVAEPGRRPDILRIECWSPPSAEREPNHTHPEQVSGFEVISGELAFWVDGREFRAGPGETASIPPAVNHRFWNPTDIEAHYIETFEPALDTRGFFEVFFRLANEGKLRPGGMPRPIHLPVLVRSFSREIRPASPPWPVTRLTAAALAPIAALRGYRDPSDL